MKKLLLIVLILLGVGGLGVYYYQRCLCVRVLPDPINAFLIEKGDSVKQIAAKLERDGYISSKICFETYAWLNGRQTAMQAGSYMIEGGKTIPEIADMFVRGTALGQERTITVIEGWNIKDIGRYFEKEGLPQTKDFLSLAAKPIKEWPFTFSRPEFLADAPANVDLEGFLFPDTYRIYEDASAEDIIKKMLDNFDQKLTPDMRAEIAKEGRSIYEVITMASLLEKEVRSQEDMKVVAGIFYDRIKYGQALESCATLAYILGENKPQYTQEDTQIDSPFNTYRNRGLPPSPIANPGLQAITAAVYPVYTEYNYFLNRPDTGATVFSRTYEEHIKNKNKYLK